MNTNRLLDQWHKLPADALRELQAHKLRNFLRDVVLPFSPHYRRLFRDLGMNADSIRTLDDLQRVPFSSKADLLPTADEPKRFTQYVIAPDRDALSRRPGDP